jgi:hypothetical protein
LSGGAKAGRSRTRRTKESRVGRPPTPSRSRSLAAKRVRSRLRHGNAQLKISTYCLATPSLGVTSICTHIATRDSYSFAPESIRRIRVYISAIPSQLAQASHSSSSLAFPQAPLPLAPAHPAACVSQLCKSRSQTLDTVVNARSLSIALSREDIGIHLLGSAVNFHFQ